MGNAKASRCGTSNRYRFPRFFFIYALQLFFKIGTVRFGESADMQQISQMKQATFADSNCNYQAPAVDIVEVEVELGFAGSAGGSGSDMGWD